MRISDWSSDVCSSDLDPFAGPPPPGGDGPCEGADRTQPARDRRRLRGARPHHGAARMPPDPRPDRHRRQAPRGLGKVDPQAQRLTTAAVLRTRLRNDQRAVGRTWTGCGKPGDDSWTGKLSTGCPSTGRGLYTLCESAEERREGEEGVRT